MTRDFAADLAEVFWHMTWDLCIDFAMFFFFTHDMGVMRRPNGQVFFHFFDGWHGNKWAMLHMTWDFQEDTDIQDGNWQVGRREEEFTTGDYTSKMGTGRYGDGKRNLPKEMGHPWWELAGREMGRGIYHRRWDIQDGNWQVGKREDEFTTWHGTSKMGTGR